MRKILTARTTLFALLCASALLQACAVTTGPWAPQRANTYNRSMTSRFDRLKSNSRTYGTDASGSYYFRVY